MNIKKYIKEAHENAVEKGFYTCQECGGDGLRLYNPLDPMCGNCEGTGIDPNKNIGELLMIIVADLGKAFTLWNDKISEYHLKNTKCAGLLYLEFKEKLADVFIRLFDLAGYMIEPENYDIAVDNIDNFMVDLYEADNFGEWMFRYIKYNISEIADGDDANYVPAGAIGRAIAALMRFCDKNNIPIEKHIEAKISYNKTRSIE